MAGIKQRLIWIVLSSPQSILLLSFAPKITQNGCVDLLIVPHPFLQVFHANPGCHGFLGMGIVPAIDRTFVIALSGESFLELFDQSRREW
jgi:hypothetical protein